MDMEAVRLRQDRQRLLLKAMTRYAYNKACRRRFLLGYFGENGPSGCKACDCCSGGTVGEACVGRPLRSVRKSRTLGATLELFRGGMAVADIARVRGLSSETILVHLADLAMAGESLDLSRVVGHERAEVILERKAWPREAVFEWLQAAGNVADPEMYRVFNCGIGMTIQLAANDVDRAMALLRDAGQESLVIGEVTRGTRGVVIV